VGRIGRWLSSKIDTYIEGVIETRINEALKCLLYGSAGDDSPPLPEDRVLIIEKTGSGSYAVCGTLSVSQGANPGEKILYSRDSNGTVKSTIKLLSTGIIELNGNADFAVAFNDLKAGFDQLKLDYNTHVHVETGASTLVPTVLSAASIDTAKVSGVKLP
jgi:hypothetical protein